LGVYFFFFFFYSRSIVDLCAGLPLQSLIAQSHTEMPMVWVVVGGEQALRCAALR
jgi:hypothetical protein